MRVGRLASRRSKNVGAFGSHTATPCALNSQESPLQNIGEATHLANAINDRDVSLTTRGGNLTTRGGNAGIGMLHADLGVDLVDFGEVSPDIQERSVVDQRGDLNLQGAQM
mmetsp:Transcript_39314/g.76323  ORF Transcript_39314/g.76323 Transcript_39314/m.76323 type:complete len:111 (+) Transcript_39314:262-594(+)